MIRTGGIALGIAPSHFLNAYVQKAKKTNQAHRETPAPPDSVILLPSILRNQATFPRPSARAADGLEDSLPKKALFAVKVWTVLPVAASQSRTTPGIIGRSTSPLAAANQRPSGLRSS